MGSSRHGRHSDGTLYLAGRQMEGAAPGADGVAAHLLEQGIRGDQRLHPARRGRARQAPECRSSSLSLIHTYIPLHAYTPVHPLPTYTYAVVRERV